MAEVKLTILGEDKSIPVVNNWENKIKSSITAVKSALTALGVTAAGLSIAAVFKKGVEAVDEFQQSVIKTAAMITSLQGQNNVAENYRMAKEYAVGLQDALIVVDAKTSLNLTNLTQITEEMIKQGVVLDYNNKSQLDAFTSLANAVAVYSQNGAQEVQVRQEVRALMMGEVDANSQLASMIQKTVDGPLKDKVKQWKASGTLVEEIGKRLVGFNAASGDIGNTWSAIKSTMETIVTRFLRGGFSEVVSTIVKKGQDIADYLKEHEELIGNRIKQGWMAVKGTAEGIYNIFVNHKGELTIIGTLVGGIVKGWGLLLTAVFPPLMARVGAFTRAIWENVQMFGNLSQMIWSGLKGDFAGAMNYFTAAKGNWMAGGQAVGEAFASGFGDEVMKRTNSFLALDEVVKKTAGTVKTPTIKPAADMAELTKQFKERAKDIIAIEKERINTLITMEKEYLETVKSSYQTHIDDLNRFKDAVKDVYKSMDDRNKAEAERAAALVRGPEDGLNRYKRLQEELLAEESKIDGTWADPAEKIKRYDELITKASEYNQSVTDNGAEIISAAEADSRYQATKIRLAEKIKSVIDEETALKEAAAIKDAENMIAAEARIKSYQNQIQVLDDMVRNLPQMKSIDIDIKINGIQDLYQISGLMKNAGINQAGKSYGDYYTQGGKTYWADGSLADDGTSFTIPGAATGGHVDKGGWVRVHDNEDIVPAQINRSGLSGTGITFAEGSIQVTVKGDNTPSAKQFVRELIPEIKLQLGRSLA